MHQTPDLMNYNFQVKVYVSKAFFFLRKLFAYIHIHMLLLVMDRCTATMPMAAINPAFSVMPHVNIYPAKQHLYLVGCNQARTEFRVLKVP